MDLYFDKHINKKKVFDEIKSYLKAQNLNISSFDCNRPWGGFFVIDEADSKKFISLYFNHLTKNDLKVNAKLSPKILIVEPQKRLSWQYHLRRAELWKLIGGSASIVTSLTNEETEIKHLNIGNIIQLKQGERHRLIGDQNNWGIIAEIWQHTNPNLPSNEDDIIRLQDDFGR